MVPVLASRLFSMSGNRIITKVVIGLLCASQTAMAIGVETTVCDQRMDYSQDEHSDSNHEIKNQLFQKQFTTAANLRQTASEAGAEWLETEGLLLLSQEQANNNNWHTAFQLVQKACLQAELALQQAETESESWKRRVVD